MMACVAIAVAVCVAGGPGVLVGQTYTCLTDTTGAAASLTNYITLLISSGDSAHVVKRQAYSLPAGTAADVAVITKANTCASAGDAYHAQVTPPNTPPIDRQLVVVKVGRDRYVVHDVNDRAGEFGVFIVFDNRWNYLASWAG